MALHGFCVVCMVPKVGFNSCRVEGCQNDASLLGPECDGPVYSKSGDTRRDHGFDNLLHA